VVRNSAGKNERSVHRHSGSRYDGNQRRHDDMFGDDKHASGAEDATGGTGAVIGRADAIG